MIEVKKVTSEVLMEVRRNVLWPHLLDDKLAVIEVDKSESAIHLAAFYKGKVVGVASLFKQTCDRFPKLLIDLEIRRLRAMGVKEDFRGKGVGDLIVKKAQEILKEEGVGVIWCDAREAAWGFYLKQNFEFAKHLDGDECDAYLVSKVGLHKMMMKRI
jgi:phosphoribosylformimino-5-aminoimidazole carboxamide ribotide isomerase